VTQAMNDIKDNVDVFVILSHLGVDKSTRNIWRSDYLIDQLTQSKLIFTPHFRRRWTFTYRNRTW